MSNQLQPPLWPGVPRTSSEYITLIARYYRAEMARMSGWRDRIDRRTNWAITVAGAMLSVSLSTASAHHGVLLFAMVLVLLLLVIESRRYSFFDVYRGRVCLLERQYFGRVFSTDGESDVEWMRGLSNDLKKPVFLMSYGLAFSRRLRRNYIWMFLILLIAWLLKISTPKLMPDGTPGHLPIRFPNGPRAPRSVRYPVGSSSWPLRRSTAGSSSRRFPTTLVKVNSPLATCTFD